MRERKRQSSSIAVVVSGGDFFVNASLGPVIVSVCYAVVSCGVRV